MEVNVPFAKFTNIIFSHVSKLGSYKWTLVEYKPCKGYYSTSLKLCHSLSVVW